MGWALEVSFEAVLHRRYVDKGVLNGPLCVVYGITGCIISVGFQDLRQGWFFLFLGSALTATVVEWAAGRILDHTTHVRWWDYSDRKWNLDGHICLEASLMWGVLGTAAVTWGTPLLLKLFRLIPALGQTILVAVLAGLLALDALDTLLALGGIRHRMPNVESAGNRLAALTIRMGQSILTRTEHRMQRTAPAAQFIRTRRTKSTVFAEGACFEKLFWLFFIGAFLGDIVETLYCRAVGGVWMSRSSLVWGPFSIVWGLGIALATKMLYRYKDRPASFLFTAGTLLGGVYEYLCSVLSELVFGTVFWDYSWMPFNLGGRINLLYCFFWGFAAVAWFKLLYPPLSRAIERIPMKAGQVLTFVLAVFMAANMLVSAAALMRADSRADGQSAGNMVAVWLDEHYDDAKLTQIYPNMIRVE